MMAARFEVQLIKENKNLTYDIGKNTEDELDTKTTNNGSEKIIQSLTTPITDFKPTIVTSTVSRREPAANKISPLTLNNNSVRFKYSPILRLRGEKQISNETELNEKCKFTNSSSSAGFQNSSNRELWLKAPFNENASGYIINSLRKEAVIPSDKTDFNQEKCNCTSVSAASTAVIAVHDALENLELKDMAVKNKTVEPFEDIKSCHTNCVNGTLKNMDDESKAKTFDLKDQTANMSNIKPESIPSITKGTTSVRPTSLLTSQINDIGTVLNSQSLVKSPKTPKTPQTTLPAQRHIQCCPNPRHAHTHYSSKPFLPSVAESKVTPNTPPVTPDSPSTYLDDDIASLYSFVSTTSGRSTMSCEHPYVARNGTTFSGRKMKYLVHCSSYAGQVGQDYLTPTQRAQRQVRRLKELLCMARQELECKDSEILRLTREVVELRLFKASLSSPDERSLSSDAVTVREAELKTSQDVSPIVDMVDDLTKSSPRHIPHNYHHQQNVMHLSSEMQSSYADSGHFEDMSVHSQATHDIACGSDEAIGHMSDISAAENYELQRQELIRSYEERIEQLIKDQENTSSELKLSHNKRVELLLQKLDDWNTRYTEIVPDYEHAKERISELETQLDNLQRKLAEQEQQQNKMYLHMYQKGQEAEKIARADLAFESAYRTPNKVSLPELLQELQSTQNELENIRVRFIKVFFILLFVLYGVINFILF